MKKIKTIIKITLLAIFLGAIWNILQTKNFDRLIEGCVHGAFIGFFLAIYHSFQKHYLRPFFSKLPLWVPNILNPLAYLFLIIVGRSLALHFFNGQEFKLLNVHGKYFFNSLIFAFLCILIFSLMNEVVFLIGKRNFLSLITGEYLRSKERERIVLFLDMSDSTKIAEKIGDSAYMDLLSDFFFFMEKPLSQTGGRIYKYIGDEAIITWNCKKECAEQALEFYTRYKNLMKINEAFFEKNHGVSPKFKGGIHCGKVIIREIGGSKKEIALIGDSLNTAARVLGIAKKEQKGLLVSADFEKLLKKTDSKFKLKSAGYFELKGKEQEMKLYEL